MDRQKAIETIQALYPVDSRYDDVRIKGAQLLERARREVAPTLLWEKESTEVLIRYAELCVEEDYQACGRIGVPFYEGLAYQEGN